MKKNIDLGMIVVLTMSAISSAKTISADMETFDNFTNNNTDILEETKSLKNNIAENTQKLKITKPDKNTKINTGKIITEKIYEKSDDIVTSAGAIENKTFDFNLKFKTSDYGDDFTLENYVDTSDVITSDSAIVINKDKISYINFNVSLGDIKIKKSTLSENILIVSQNEKDTFVYSGKKIMFSGNSDKNSVFIEDGITTDIIFNNVSISSENGFKVSDASNINIKLINDTTNTIKNLKNKGTINIYGETGILTSREFTGKVNINGGVIKASKKCSNISSLVVTGGSVDIKTDINVTSEKEQPLKCYQINIDKIKTSEIVEVDVKGNIFITKTDIKGNIYLYLPNEDNKVVIKNKNTAFITEIQKCAVKNYIASEIPKINRVDVNVYQEFNKDGKIDAVFQIEIPKNIKYSDDFSTGIQCFENGWLLDDTISQSNIATLVKNTDNKYELKIKGLECGKNYKCRVFSVNNETIDFSDLMEFKTKKIEDYKADKYDNLKISGLSKTFNNSEQNIDIETNVKYNVIYYKDGKKLDSSPVDTGKYIAKVIVNDDKHEYFEKNFEFVINPAEPTISKLPYATNVVIGNKLSSSKFVGGITKGISGEIDGTYNWKNENSIIQEAKSFNVEFVPTDKNYSSVEFSLYVNTDTENQIKFTTNLEKNIEIDENKLLILKTDAVSNNGKAVIYQWYKDNELIEDAVSSILVKNNISKKDEGEYYVVATSLDGCSSESQKCSVKVNIEEEKSAASSNPSLNINNKSLIITNNEEAITETITETSAEITTETATETTTFINDINTNENNKSSEKKTSSDYIDTFTEETSEDFSEEASEDFSEETSDDSYSDDDYNNSQIKRITDDMLVEIYGKVTYPDINTVSATTAYKSDYAGQKSVFQLNENGCFIEVAKYTFNGNNVNILTDRDFPIIVGKKQTYSDCKTHWDSDDISFVSAFDIMPVHGDSFNPESNVTRGDFIQALYNLAGKPEYSLETEFSDVSKEGSYYDAISWAYEQDLIKGRSETEFGLNLSVTREQAAVVISKYIEKMGFLLPANSVNYSDLENISDWAITAVNKVSSAKIMGDLGYNRFEPKAFCSRAETTTLLKKIIQYNIVF